MEDDGQLQWGRTVMEEGRGGWGEGGKRQTMPNRMTASMARGSPFAIHACQWNLLDMHAFPAPCPRPRPLPPVPAPAFPLPLRPRPIQTRTNQSANMVPQYSGSRRCPCHPLCHLADVSAHIPSRCGPDDPLPSCRLLIYSDKQPWQPWKMPPSAQSERRVTAHGCVPAVSRLVLWPSGCPTLSLCPFHCVFVPRISLPPLLLP